MATVIEFQNKVSDIVADLPRLLGNETVKFFKQQMQQEEDVHGNAYTDRRYESRLQRGKRVLSDRGNLQDAIEILSIDKDSVVVGVDEKVIVYAGIHNEGGQIVVTAKMRNFFFAKWKDEEERGNEDDAMFFRNMLAKKAGDTIDIPKREFVGDSSLLREHLEEAVQRFVNARLSVL